MKAWRVSEDTARGYCRKRGLKLSSLRYWSGRIRREAEDALDEACSEPVRMATVRVTRCPERSPLRVVVGDVHIEVGPGFDEETFGQVLAVVVSAGGGR